MKKLLIALAAVLVTVASYGQGTVNFGNLGGGVNAPVLLGTTGHGPGPDYVAQLFLQQGNNYTALTPTSPFRAAGTGAQAVLDQYFTTVSGLTVPGVATGSPATFVVRAYKSSYGSFDAAKAAGEFGESAPVTTTGLGGGINLPPNLTGLTGFSITQVPEPSVIALGVLGASALLLRRRK